MRIEKKCENIGGKRIKNKTMTQPKPNNKGEWEKEFDKVFENSGIGDFMSGEVKSFIKTLLKTQKEQWKQQIREGMKKMKIELLDTINFQPLLDIAEGNKDIDWWNDEVNEIYNQIKKAIDDLTKIIEKKDN